MATMNLSTTVAAPVAEVWSVFSDFRNAPGRIKGIKKIEILTDGPIGVGTKFKETREMFKKEAVETMEVTAFEPNRMYTLECMSCGGHVKFTFRFAPSGRGTQVDVESKCRAVTLFAKLLSPLTSLMMGPMMRKCLLQDIEDLKAVVEKK